MPIPHQELQSPSAQVGDKVVFENNHVRVWHTTLEPNKRLPAHCHYLPYLWTSLTSGTSVSHYADGKTKTVRYQPGDTRYFNLSHQNGFIHDLNNIGNTTLQFVTIEFLNTQKQPNIMKAIQFHPSDSLETPTLTELPTPEPNGHDILVKIEAVAMNPVDTKVRPDSSDTEPATLGYDASGIITAIGSDVTSLSVGDHVFYAGDISRPGSNAEYQLVDSRIAARRPTTLNAAASAALPLTSLTAWESLFHRLDICPKGNDAGKSILIIGGAGGVGSIAIQLAKRAGLTVIATASRSESSDWCRRLGADHTINHKDPLAPQLQQLGYDNVDYIANYHDTAQYWQTMGEVIAPQGHIVLIVETEQLLDLGGPFKNKSVTIAWELMFTRPMFRTADIQRQQEILSEIARLIDAGELHTTQTVTLSPITPETIHQAHQLQQSKKTIGKITITNDTDETLK